MSFRERNTGPKSVWQAGMDNDQFNEIWNDVWDETLHLRRDLMF